MSTVARVSSTSAVRPRWSSDGAVAGLATLLVASRVEIKLGITMGTAAALLLIPVWWPILRRFRGARALLGLGLIAVASGVVLTIAAPPDREIHPRLTITMTMLLVQNLVGIAVILWARTTMPDYDVALFYGMGLVVGIGSAPNTAINPWKFGIGTPVTILVLALAWRSGKLWVQVAAATAVAAVSALNDARSAFALMLLAVLLTLAHATAPLDGARSSRARVLGLALALGFVIYQGGQALILEGYLGESTQIRTERQLDKSGSLLLGARPEMAATAALMRHHPMGFGAGTQANPEDVDVVKQGMSALNYDPNHNGYVERYMLGDGFEVHSILGDLWARSGVAGLLLAVSLVGATVHGYTGLPTRGRAVPLLAYLLATTCWNLFFSPVRGSSLLLPLALGLLLLPSSSHQTAPTPGPHPVPVPR